ncbi:MAG: TonB-dependent receptor family protein [Chitinophagales bacterium]
MLKFILTTFLIFGIQSLYAQKTDTVVALKEVKIKGYKTITGMGHLDEVHDGVIYSGQKNEVLILDSIDANTAQDNPRQVLGRVPGSNYSETEGSGFPANGIGFRGLNPTQSVETNTRQNGYNIAGDVYGYPESYYQTPLEATERVEIIRGASALQFGPQFGGVVNYIVKKGPENKPFEFTTEQTIGSYGLINSFNSAGGTWKKWNYYTFVEYEQAQGWRENSQLQQVTGFAKVEYRANANFKIGLEYSLLRNLLHMPGGLDDAEFNQNPERSFRARNWLITPWNIAALTSTYKISDKTMFTLKSAFNMSSRSIVWRNEDGGPETPDNFDPLTNTYVPREVEHEYFKSSTTELRMLTNYNLSGREQTLAAGVRFFDGRMKRQQGGVGSTGIGPDFTNYNPGNTYNNDLDFTTINIAPFIENTFHLGERLSITPGFRFEYIKSTATGHVLDSTGSYNIAVNESKPRYIPLAGIAFQYKTSRTTNIYANITEAYTPISYSFLYPMGQDIDAKIDPKLKDITGYNADLGYRGNIKNYLTFDVSGFYMARNNNIAIETVAVNGIPGFYETNVGDATHIGIETYVELNVVKLFTKHSKVGAISFFNSFAYDDAKYINGLYKGNTCEYAPATIDRFGITYAIKRFSTTFLFSNTAKSYADANNTVFSPDAETGVIPAYTVMDWSATLKIKDYNIKFGVNNLADAKYFTFRTVEYPGPGIIPSAGRTWYLGFGARF